MNIKIKSYKDLKTWQKAMDLVLFVYGSTKLFPKDEIYGLTSQMRRAAVSIPSNIAEGSERGSTRDFMRFLKVAKSSLAELETQMLIAMKLDYLVTEKYFAFSQNAAEVGRMINGLLNKLEDKLATDDWPLATTE